MTYRVELTEQAARNFEHIYRMINAEDTAQARLWSNGLEKTILSLDEYPDRGAAIAEDKSLRHLLYRRRRHLYRIIYSVNDTGNVVTVLHIRQQNES